jgi:hypothetical protein
MMGVMEVRGQIHRRCIALVSRGWKSSVSEHGLEVEVFGNQERRCGGWGAQKQSSWAGGSSKSHVATIGKSVDQPS